jgi:hypothetical protein
MRATGAAALFLAWTVPAQAGGVSHICTVMLLDAAANARGDVLAAAEAQLDREGCQPGDPLIVIAAGVRPAQLTGALCRRGAGVQVSEKLDEASVLMQVDYEYPGLRSRRRAGW